MGDSIAEKIRDDLTEQDIRYRRADAGVRAEVNKRLDLMDSQIMQKVWEVDVAGAKRNQTRRRRLQKLNREIGEVTRKAFSDINEILKDATRRIAKVEAKNVIKVVQENLP